MSRLAERSRNLYESDAQRFAEWCRKRGEDPLPASETTIRSYVAHLREHGRAASTIKRALTAIRYTHRAHGLAFPDCPVVLAPPPRTRNSPGRARPLRLEELRRLVDSLPSDTPAGLRDRALFLLGFFSSARPRELLLLDVDHPIHAPDPWAPLPSQRGSRRNTPLVLSALPDMAELNPLIAVQEWKRQLAAQGIHEGPLFRRIDRHGRVFGGDRIPAGRSAGDGRLSVRGYNGIVRTRGAQAGLDLRGLSTTSLRLADPARQARERRRMHAARNGRPALKSEWRSVASEYQLTQRRQQELPRSGSPSTDGRPSAPPHVDGAPPEAAGAEPQITGHRCQDRGGRTARCEGPERPRPECRDGLPCPLWSGGRGREAVGTSDPAAQCRVEFDAEVVFSNGGSLRTEGFRLDIPGDDISDAELGELLVRHLGLLMVERTTITRKQLIREPHKGSRGTEGSNGERTVVDLTGEATTAALPNGLELERSVDLPVALVRLLGAEKPVADRLALAALELAGHAVLVHTGTDGPFLTDEAAELLVERGAALVASDARGPVPDPLSRAGVPVVTGLANLDALPPFGTRLHAVPFPGADGPPRVRVYAVADG